MCLPGSRHAPHSTCHGCAGALYYEDKQHRDSTVIVIANSRPTCSILQPGTLCLQRVCTFYPFLQLPWQSSASFSCPKLGSLEQSVNDPRRPHASRNHICHVRHLVTCKLQERVHSATLFLVTEFWWRRGWHLLRIIMMLMMMMRTMA